MNTPPGIWRGQARHLISLTALLALTWLAWAYTGKPLATLFWFTVAVPVMHQLFVWLCWRLELRASLVSHMIGFKGYLGLFFLLFGTRFISLFLLAWFDRGSLELHPLPQVALTLILLIPGIYAMYSVRRYFGMARAAGADHFDPAYRSMPLVNQGIFRFTDNAMYLYAFLLFWAIAISLNSSAALIVAGFSHAYIWVHFYCSEKPDMDYIYGSL